MCMEPNNRTEDLTEESALPLREAYPMPRYSIKDAVMAQIAAERAACAVEKDKKVLTFAEKMRKRQAQIMKWGGMAACFMILCGVLIIASPIMKNVNGSTEAEAADCMAVSEETMQETAAAQAASAGNGPVMYSAFAGTTLTADEDAYGDEEVIDGYTAGAEQNSTTSDQKITLKKAPEEQLQDTVETAAETNAAIPEAGEQSADDKTDVLGWIKATAVKGIEEDRYAAWLTDKGYGSESDYSLAELVTAFGLARETLTALLGEYAGKVDMDTLYGDAVQKALTDGKTAEELDAMVVIG